MGSIATMFKQMRDSVTLYVCCVFVYISFVYNSLRNFLVFIFVLLNVRHAPCIKSETKLLWSSSSIKHMKIT
jgi:hypothetical protein